MTINKFSIMFCLFFSSFFLMAQHTITGKMTDESNQPIANLPLILGGANLATTTDASGVFTFKEVPDGTYNLIVSTTEYEAFTKSVTINQDLIVGTLQLKKSDDGIVQIDASDLDLDLDDGSSAGAVSFLQSTVSPFREAAAFQWGQFFFRPRAYDLDKSQINFNGIIMNKATDGRPLFRDWGGLNDITRYPLENKYGNEPSIYTLGSVGGVTSFSTRASDFSKGGRASVALTNSSYTQRVTAMYASGMMPSGWAFTVAGSRRWAEEGVQDGTKYDAWSYFIALERKLSEKHSLNFTTFGAPYKRAGASPNTQEVYDLNDGIHYNAYWGWQNGEQRNERIRRSFQPIYMLTHYWKINENTKLENTISYQNGRNGYTRLGEGRGYYNGSDYDFANDASPVYYRYLPSYEGTSDIKYNNMDPNAGPVLNSQINWAYLYLKNYENALLGKEAAHFLVEDVNKDKYFNAISQLQTRFGNHISLNGHLSYQNFYSKNYREIYDLLGGLPISNRDFFNDLDYNMLDNDELINEGDTFDYSYKLYQHKGNAYLLLNYTTKFLDFYLGGDYTYTSMWRRGNFQYEAAKLDSYGVSDKKDFNNFGIKGGLVSKINGKDFFNFNALYQTNAPTIKDAFPAIQYLNYYTDDLKSNKILATDLTYTHNGRKWKGSLSGFYTQIKDDISNQTFYDEDGQDIFGIDDDGFLYTALKDVDTKHYGLEIGAEYKITNELKMHGAASIAQAIYSDNPSMNALLISNVMNSVNRNYVNETNYNKFHFKDYKVSGTPQKAFNLGLEYNSPSRWWVGLDWNLLKDNYVSITPIKHSDVFTANIDRSIFVPGGIDTTAEVQERIDTLLRQERFSTEYYLNINMGKSWRINNNNLIASLSITNLLNNEAIKTGGFEQGRTSTYESANHEYERQLNGETPAFGNKYWYQQGMQFFFNISYKF